ncbi:ROK family protein [Kyrpidia spormannii]|uniref:ROK family protein n=1 Tax=Kyrpidia spormannii TaxID=2055160 RepID=A0A2K8N756_9BACL|nr:ROK family transcriptional regulator [Kyrpidia spormannii]ATY85123.1 ROK family protein [Kyrpidia spormannii]
MIKKPVTGDQNFIKQLNRSVVLDAIRRHSPLSRTDIADLTGLNKATVSNLVRELQTEHLVQDVGEGRSHGGRRPQLLVFRKDAGYVLAGQLDVHYLLMALTNLDGQVVWKRRVSLPPNPSVDQVTETAAAISREAEGAVDGTAPYGIIGVGLGIPGIVDHKNGMILRAPNLNWTDVPFRTLLSAKTGRPVVIDNDANCGAIAELRYGFGRDTANLLYVSIGTGIGVGIVADGRLYRGGRGSAGEFGHTSLYPDGPQCTCGNRGCWELYASVSALSRVFRQKRGGTAGWPYDPSSWEELSAIKHLTDRGDRHALDALHHVGEYLGVGVSSLIQGLNPEAVIIGNDMALFGPSLLAVIRQEVRKRVFPFNQDHLILDVSRLGEDSVLIGASAMVVEQFFARVETAHL